MSHGCFPRLFFLALLLIFLPALLAAPVRQTTLIGIASGTGKDAQIWGAGTWDRVRGWREIEASKKEFRPNTAFGIYNLTGKMGSATLKKLTEAPEVHGWYSDVTNATGFPGEAKNALAVTSASTPRRIKTESNDAQVYVKLVKEYLAKRGVTVQKPRLTQNLRVDLDGDGTDEVLICASSRPDFGRTPEVRVGDYMLVLLRAVGRNGQPKTIALASEFSKKAIPFSAPGYENVLAVADLNADGQMEIVLETGYYEGSGMEIWTWNGIQATRVLESGTGE